MDNETSTEVEHLLNDKKIQYVPTSNHRANQAKRVIDTVGCS